MIELQGYSLEPLSKVRYDVVNTAGSLLNQEGYVTSHWFDTNIFEFTTNWFQCLDIDLAEGDNFVTVYATDRAGNVSTNNFTYTLDYSNDVTLPAIEISWPTDGTEISGDTFTCRGRLDDFTAKLTLTLTDQSGGAITRTAIVERNGKFWLEDLPLASGTSQLTLVATDAAGNSSTTEICVTRSDLVLTMNPVADDLWQPAVTVSGTVSDASYTVWVNDVEATVNPDGTWSASEVPVNEGGTASFVVSAYAPEEQ
jgi:hypothetical protein